MITATPHYFSTFLGRGHGLTEGSHGVIGQIMNRLQFHESLVQMIKDRAVWQLFIASKAERPCFLLPIFDIHYLRSRAHVGHLLSDCQELCVAEIIRLLADQLMPHLAAQKPLHAPTGRRQPEQLLRPDCIAVLGRLHCGQLLPRGSVIQRADEGGHQSRLIVEERFSLNLQGGCEHEASESLVISVTQ